MASVHTIADGSAKAEDLLAVNTQAVELSDALTALEARVALLESARDAMVAQDCFQWQQLVGATNSLMASPTHELGDGVAATISGTGFTVAEDCKAAIVTVRVHNNYSASTGARRRFQVYASGTDTWAHESAAIVAGVDVQTGDRHSMTYIAQPGGTYNMYAYMGQSATVTFQARVLAIF